MNGVAVNEAADTATTGSIAANNKMMFMANMTTDCRAERESDVEERDKRAAVELEMTSIDIYTRHTSGTAANWSVWGFNPVVLKEAGNRKQGGNGPAPFDPMMKNYTCAHAPLGLIYNQQFISWAGQYCRHALGNKSRA
jgi:hypothetical protein